MCLNVAVFRTFPQDQQLLLARIHGSFRDATYPCAHSSTYSTHCFFTIATNFQEEQNNPLRTLLKWNGVTFGIERKVINRLLFNNSYMSKGLVWPCKGDMRTWWSSELFEFDWKEIDSNVAVFNCLSFSSHPRHFFDHSTSFEWHEMTQV